MSKTTTRSALAATLVVMIVAGASPADAQMDPAMMQQIQGMRSGKMSDDQINALAGQTGMDPAQLKQMMGGKKSRGAKAPKAGGQMPSGGMGNTPQ